MLRPVLSRSVLVSLVVHISGACLIWIFAQSSHSIFPSRSFTQTVLLDLPNKKSHSQIQSKPKLVPHSKLPSVSSEAKNESAVSMKDGEGKSTQISEGVANQCLTQFHEQIEAAVEYPVSIRRRRLQGEVILKINIHSNGKIESLTISQSSGHIELDQLAQEAAMRASPFICKSEDEKPTGKFTLNLPIGFRLD